LGLGKAFDLYKTCAKGSLPEQIGEENRRRWDWLIDVQRKTDVKMFVMVSIKVFFTPDTAPRGTVQRRNASDPA